MLLDNDIREYRQDKEDPAIVAQIFTLRKSFDILLIHRAKMHLEIREIKERLVSKRKLVEVGKRVRVSQSHSVPKSILLKEMREKQEQDEVLRKQQAIQRKREVRREERRVKREQDKRKRELKGKKAGLGQDYWPSFEDDGQSEDEEEKKAEPRKNRFLKDEKNKEGNVKMKKSVNKKMQSSSMPPIDKV